MWGSRKVLWSPGWEGREVRKRQERSRAAPCFEAEAHRPLATCSWGWGPRRTGKGRALGGSVGRSQEDSRGQGPGSTPCVGIEGIGKL